MKEFGFIGAGKMASSIVKGLIASRKELAGSICCTCGNDATGLTLAQDTGIELYDSPKKVFADSKTVVAACKPQQLAAVAKAAEGVKCGLLISILAGTSIKRLRECFGGVGTIVRIMPNMAAQIGMGIAAYAPEKKLTAEERAALECVLGAMGEFIEVEEKQMDAVTALSGSGPGYVFEFAAAMIEAGKNIGFTEEDSKKLTYKTLLGSAMLLMKSPLGADELRNAVSSPGGTTLAALDVFAKSGFRQTVDNALKAARDRSRELSKL